MNILSKFKKSIGKSSNFISSGINQVINSQIINDEILQQIEDLLIEADFGVDVSKKLIEKIKYIKIKEEINLNNLKLVLAEEIEKILLANEQIFEIKNINQQRVCIIVGVNGSGKTTSLAKLANLLSKNNKVLISACDTFRAAAIEQIEEWSNKINISLYKGKINQDPASVAFEASEKLKKENFDILMVDTAGRLSNNKNLMDQLSKIKKVINKSLNNIPIETILILDASTGNNILNQFEAFNNIIGISGLIITKLDGTAKGGAIIAVALKYNIPIYFIGIGEEIDDLYYFKAKEFSYSLFDIKS